MSTCRYRITLMPRSGRGKFRLQAIVTGDMQAVVDAGELDFVRFHAAELACEYFGDDGPRVLKVSRVEREELGGAWRDRRWPLPMPTAIADVVFSKDGHPLTNVIPTWPE